MNGAANGNVLVFGSCEDCVIREHIYIPYDLKSASNAAAEVAVLSMSTPPGGESVLKAHEKPPAWFVNFFDQFEVRRNAKFEMILSECREEHESLKYDLDIIEDKVAKLSKAYNFQ